MEPFWLDQSDLVGIGLNLLDFFGLVGLMWISEIFVGLKEWPAGQGNWAESAVL